MFNTIVGAGAVGAGAASRYGSGSGSDQKMRLRHRNTDYLFQMHKTVIIFVHIFVNSSQIDGKYAELSVFALAFFGTLHL
jgi:hypothetical protein